MHHCLREIKISITTYIYISVSFFQLRRPQRPHDIQLFDPAFRLPSPPQQPPPPSSYNNKPRGVSFRRYDDDIERLPRSSLRSSFVGKDKDDVERTRSSSTRSSLVVKEKPGEKLVKRVLASEGLGRSAGNNSLKILFKNGHDNFVWRV